MRLHLAAKSLFKNPSAMERRGIGEPANKTKPEDKEYLKKFINSFPRYKSHYTRKHTTKEYLPPNLNIKKMYKEYENICEFRGRLKVSEFVYRNIFNKEFNLGFKRPQKDTCDTCNAIKAAKLCSVLSENAREQLETRSLRHHSLVADTNNDFKKDVLSAKVNEENLCLTFDLQKTLECPSQPTTKGNYGILTNASITRELV